MGELCDKEIREHARISTTYSPNSSSSDSLYILTRRVLEIHQVCNEQQHSAGDLQCNLANIGIFSVNRLIELLYEENQDYEVINRMLANNPRVNIDPVQERTLIFLREGAMYMHMRYCEDNEYYHRMMDHYCKMDGDNTGYKYALPNGDLNCEMDEDSGVYTHTFPTEDLKKRKADSDEVVGGMIVELFQDAASLPGYDEDDSDEEDSYESIPGLQERAEDNSSSSDDDSDDSDGMIESVLHMDSGAAIHYTNHYVKSIQQYQDDLIIPTGLLYGMNLYYQCDPGSSSSLQEILSAADFYQARE
jgi:hypothetical protein